MRWVFVFRTAFKQKVRDRFGLLLSLLTAPVFVVFYWLFFSGTAAVHEVAVVTESPGDAASLHADSVVEALGNVRRGDGTPFLTVEKESDRASLIRRLRRGELALGVVLRREFAGALADADGPPAVVVFRGDATRGEFHMASAIVSRALEQYISQVRQAPPTVEIVRSPLGLSGARTPFETYVPGLLVFAVIMLIFSVSMSVVKEVESGTMARLRLTPATTVDILVGLSVVQMMIGGVSVLCTLGVAAILGFRSEGSLLLAMGVTALAALSSVGVGMVVASLSRTQTRAFLFSSVAMFLLILFAGIVFPRPQVEIVTIAGRTLDLFDILPTTHMASALGKVMTLGATWREISWELGALVVISSLSYLCGGLLLMRSGRPSATAWEGVV